MAGYPPCCGQNSSIPAQSPAQNIIADFRINLVTPNTNVLYQAGPSFQILQSNISQIQTKLTQIVYNVDPNAPSTYKFATWGVFGGFFLVFAMFVSMSFVGGAFIFVGVAFFFLLFFSMIAYNCWVRGYCRRWSEKVLPQLLNYVQNEFKKTYSQTIDIHILHPIQEFRRGRRGQRMVANWVVIRITNGPIQQPINAPVYWSSNGTIIQPQVPIVVQQPQTTQPMTYGQQPIVMQPQQQMYQQPQQQQMYTPQQQQMMYQQPQQQMYQPVPQQNQFTQEGQQQQYNVNNTQPQVYT